MLASSILLILSIVLSPGSGLNLITDGPAIDMMETTNENTTDATPFVNATVLSGIDGIILINEVELNPLGSDVGEEWVELYNPSNIDANTSGFAINTSKSVVMELPDELVIEGGEATVVYFENSSLSNVAEILTLVNSSSGEGIDSTPSFVDSKDNGYTWQRVPDGDEEWEFLEQTRGDLNDPYAVNADKFTGERVKQSDGCVGAAGCVEAVAIRIVDGDTLYVSAEDAAYKVELALVQAPDRNDDDFLDSTMFTRSLCLGSRVLVDQDDNQLAEDGSVIASVYCSSVWLNEELLDKEFARLETEQCESSEFAVSDWAREHGC